MKGLAASNTQIQHLLDQHNNFLTKLHQEQPGNQYVKHLARKRINNNNNSNKNNKKSKIISDSDSE